MKTRKQKNRNGWLAGFRILVYMNTKRQTKKKVHWLSITRVFVLLWGGLMFLYHVFWIGMTWKNGGIQHIIGVALEYLISGIYENSIIRMNKFINKKTLNSKHKTTKRILLKYLTFSAIFGVTYNVVYTGRMLILYLVNLGMLDWAQTQTAIINGAIFCVTIGPILGMIITYAREKKINVKIIKSPSE